MFGDVKKVWRGTRTLAADQALAFRDPQALRRYRRLCGEYHAPDYHVSVLPDRKLIYIEVPKAASSTIKVLLLASLGEFEEDGLAVHNRYESGIPTMRQVGVSRFFRIVDDPIALIFTFVRNPFARIVSCYRDKFAPFALANERSGCNFEAWAFFGDRLNRLDADKPLPFAWFVDMACATARTTMNGHSLAMDRIIPADDVRCKIVGRVENFDRDILPICDRLGVPPVKRKLNTTGPTRLSDWIDSTTAAAIRLAYAEDFERFGYSTTVP